MTKQLHAFHSDFTANWEHAETQYLSPCRWSPNPPPHVSVQALWRDDALIFRLCSDTPPSRAVNTAQDSPVWEDSCLECFLSADGQHYLNLEGNANAAMLAAFGPDRNNRQRLADMGIPRPRLQAAACGTGWEAVYTVPAETLHLLFDVCPVAGLELWTNFYVCGDKTPSPCYGAWNDVQTETPDFHRPEFFGRLILK